MKTPFARLAAGLILGLPQLAAQYATEVVSYVPGTGFSPGRTNTVAALGEPSRSTPGPFGGPVDPFAPPYTSDQLLSVGSGGSLVVRFQDPIRNAPDNPFGIDFNVFGGGGFLVTNAFDADFNYIGTPSTDGTLFNPNNGQTRVGVSEDGSTWYTLDPARAPKVDDLFPTDGQGAFTVPVSPSLRTVPLGGLTLSQLRTLYGGSAGGTGFDLAWALDSEGQAVPLDSVRFVRIEVLSGRAEIDGLAAVSAVPEPGIVALLGLGSLATLTWNRRRRFQR